MNKIIFVSLILFLAALPLVSAVPVIENVSFMPPGDAWLGEDVSISLDCFDNGNNTIEEVYADITGPDIVLPRLYFSESGGDYKLFVDNEYLDRTGQFNATISCKNNVSTINTTMKSFTVSELTGYINAISPDPVYLGDTIEIDFILKKNDVKISSGVVFNVSLNNQLKNLKIGPVYDSNKGWILKIDAPTTAGIYDVKLVSFYNRTNVICYDSADVRNNIEFNIDSIDKNWIKPNDNITVTLKALEKGSVIGLNKNNTRIKINSVDAVITSISQHDSLFSVKIVAPSMSSGRYQLEAYLDHGGSSYSDNEPIDYIVSIEGAMVDENNKAITATMKFIQDDIIKLSVSTDAYGHYSSSLPPDTYDLEINLPKSTLYLYGASISSFSDPIKYFYSDETAVAGIRNAGLYAYDIDLSYSRADIEMRYTENNILNENNLRVFKCSNWNSGREICNDDWEEVGGEIDVIRNKVRLLSSTLSAFVIGETKSLDADFSLDKEMYNLGDKIKLTGIVKDEDGDNVGNASINAYIKNTKINYNLIADDNGVFSIEFTSPENEGEYTIVLKAKNPPYNDFKGENKFKIAKSKSVFIDFPDTIKIARGENFTQEFSLLNNGQAKIDNIKISLEGIPEIYYKIVDNEMDLETDEKKTLYIDFFIPVYAEAGISSATLKVENNGITEEKVFGFNIFEKAENETSPTTGFATGFTLPQINYLDLVYIVMFAAFCFFVAIILKKRKIGKDNGSDVKIFLFDVGSYLKNRKHEIEKNKSQNERFYDKLIITEFPNVMRLSRDLTKNKGD